MVFACSILSFMCKGLNWGKNGTQLVLRNFFKGVKGRENCDVSLWVSGCDVENGSTTTRFLKQSNQIK